MSMEREHEALRPVRRVLTSTAAALKHATETNVNEPNPTIADYATALNGVNQPMNNLFKVILWWSLGILALFILTIRMFQRYRAHTRHLAAMSLPGEQQVYWTKNHWNLWWKFKKVLLYAPLGKKRHNREIRLSSAMNMGTIPSRFHTILLTGFILSNFAYSCVLDYSKDNHYSIVAELRGRTGVLAIINMIALVIFAGRNNPLIPLLQISFDTYNLFHRWIGRVVVLEAVVHTVCWAYVKHVATGWHGMWDQLATDPFAGWGAVSTVSMVLILVLSLSPVRHAFYETFINVHIILAFLAIVGIYIHCVVAQLPQLPYIRVIIVLWALDRIVRMLRIVWYNYSRKEGWTNATVEALPGDCCRVTLHLPRKVNVKPGSHAYLRFAAINAWESHPFSIAWVEHKVAAFTFHTNDKNSNTLSKYPEKHYEKSPVTVSVNDVGQDLEQGPGMKIRGTKLVTDVSFVIHAQTGLTRKLFNKANNSSPRIITLKAAFEGPYAGHHSLDSYGHAVLFAGSSGISHQIPFVKHLIAGYNDKSIAMRKITLVWIVRDSEHLEWVRPWMDTILKMPNRRNVLTIKLFVTRPKNPREIISPSATVQMYPGRPNVKLLMENEVKEQVGAMCVTVCGPGGLADNVRDSVRNAQELGVVDFIEESFTW